MNKPEDMHFNSVVKAIADGRVVPFFGAGVNSCGRAEKWKPYTHLPNGTELASHLAASFAYPPDEPLDLIRVSQYIALMEGMGPLYQELHYIFDFEYTPTILHRFFAALPALLRSKGYPGVNMPWCQRLVIITTNYDDVMERAFREADEKYHLVSYMATTVDREEPSRFLHWPPGKPPVTIKKSNDISTEYDGLEDDTYPIILKIHGAVDRVSMNKETAQFDSYVITEDHYIDYLTRQDITSLLPTSIVAILKKSSFLFLGYSLRDWNLRGLLHRIWREQKLDYKNWAVLLEPNKLDQAYWTTRNVDFVTMDLEKYIKELDNRLRNLEVKRGR